MKGLCFAIILSGLLLTGCSKHEAGQPAAVLGFDLTCHICTQGHCDPC